MDRKEFELSSLVINQQDAPVLTPALLAGLRRCQVTAHDAQQMRRRNRFEQVVGEGSVGDAHRVRLLDETRERQDRHLLVFPERPKLGYEVEAIEIRQQQILQYQVG